MIINRRIATAIATSALIFNSFATSAFAASTITVTGNGADSNNTANINLTKSNSVVQTNNANITNNVAVNAKTGGNNANKNTGGDVNVSTGDASVGVQIQNAVNKNSAELACCPNGDTSVNISGNGADSKNKVDLDWTSNNSVFQNNTANVKNNVDVDAKTGGNDANKNTGGDVSVSTGDASVGVDLSTLANMNLARIGGGDSAGNGSLSLWILGNGADSHNNIDADVKDHNAVVQNNDANVNNTVETDASTGYNDANKNTGGDVNVETGDALVGVQVKNAANFNFADLSCGCLFDDLTAKIAGNGADSKNKIDLDLSQNDNEKASLTQNNDATLKNKLDDLNASTGYNDANENSGGVLGSDPALSTGDSEVGVSLDNQANMNTAGMGVELDFNLDDLLNMIFG